MKALKLFFVIMLMYVTIATVGYLFFVQCHSETFGCNMVAEDIHEAYSCGLIHVVLTLIICAGLALIGVVYIDKKIYPIL